jgi:hypothetical protein
MTIRGDNEDFGRAAYPPGGMAVKRFVFQNLSGQSLLQLFNERTGHP